MNATTDTIWSYINETFLETSSYRPNNHKKQTKGMDMVKLLECSENLKKKTKLVVVDICTVDCLLQDYGQNK